MRTNYESDVRDLHTIVLPLIYKRVKRSKFHWYVAYLGILPSKKLFVILQSGDGKKYKVFTYDRLNKRFEHCFRFKTTVIKTKDEINIDSWLGGFTFALTQRGTTRYCWGGEVTSIIVLNQII